MRTAAIHRTALLASVLAAAAIVVALPTSAAADVARPAVHALPATATTIAGSYRPVAPERLLDTRSSATHPVSGTVLHVQVVGVHGLPTSGIRAVFLHITVTSVHRAGYVTAYPDLSAAPGTSTVNYAVGQVTTNNVLVAPGSNGAVALRNMAGRADVVVDVLGWVVGGAGDSGLVPVRPTRLLDTRTSGSSRLTGATMTLPVVGPGLVPAGAADVVVNVTATGATRSSPITVWPSGPERPVASSLNTSPERAVAAQVITQIGSDGSISLAMVGSGSTQLVVDLLGYVTDAAASSSLVPVPVHRLLDTRAPKAPFAVGAARVITVAGANEVPADASAAIVTLTSVPSPSAGGYLTAFAHGATQPATSVLNPQRDVPVASQVVVPLGPDGRLTLSYQFGSGDVVVDLTGFVPARTLPAVQPSVLGSADVSPLADGQRGVAESVLTTANRYALQTWWPQFAPALLARPFGGGLQSDKTDPVRRLSMEAFSLSVSLATGAYDAAATGFSAGAASDVVAKIVAAVACSHRASHVGGWGATWQSAMWSSYAGRAAWLVWDALPGATQGCVQRMVISEADFVSTLKPKYMMAKDGTAITPGDTGAEEDSWYALAPALAVAMMPTAEQRDVWRHHEQQFLVAAWARPRDVTSATQIDGEPLSSWLAGSNVAANGVVTNHSRVAPDYSTNAYQSVDTLEMAVLAGEQAPQASLFGLSAVYAAMSTVSYRTPAYDAPGGNVYQPASAHVYYPQGCDWGTGQELPYALFDADADVFGLDGGALQSAPDAAARHLGEAQLMQQQTPSGQMYSSTTQYRYAGAEEHTAQLAAQVYLAYFTQDRLQVEITSQRVGTHGPDVVTQFQPAPHPVNEGPLHR